MTAISPPEACHVSQIQPKIVRVIDEAADMYVSHPYFGTVPPEFQEVGLKLLEQMAGNEYLLLSARQIGGIVWYNVLLSPPIQIVAPQGMPTLYKYFELDAMYTVIVDHGYMEAK